MRRRDVIRRHKQYWKRNWKHPHTQTSTYTTIINNVKRLRYSSPFERDFMYVSVSVSLFHLLTHDFNITFAHTAHIHCTLTMDYSCQQSTQPECCLVCSSIILYNSTVFFSSSHRVLFHYFIYLFLLRTTSRISTTHTHSLTSHHTYTYSSNTWPFATELQWQRKSL